FIKWWKHRALIQVLRFNNGGEFLNQGFNKFLQDHNIIHQHSCPYTLQQNGVTERKNIHLLEVLRASLFDTNMSWSFWGEVVLSAAYLINRIPLQIGSPSRKVCFHWLCSSSERLSMLSPSESKDKFVPKSYWSPPFIPSWVEP
ncbi:hypothetical protein Prudu_002420, partial [Prunus dulcis]